jgi:hypothetical protein
MDDRSSRRASSLRRSLNQHRGVPELLSRLRNVLATAVADALGADGTGNADVTRWPRGRFGFVTVRRVLQAGLATETPYQAFNEVGRT